jgi:hypothetical protein
MGRADRLVAEIARVARAAQDSGPQQSPIGSDRQFEDDHCLQRIRRASLEHRAGIGLLDVPGDSQRRGAQALRPDAARCAPTDIEPATKRGGSARAAGFSTTGAAQRGPRPQING